MSASGISEASLANLRPFKPGQSGNPLGRPKSDPIFRARCRQFVDEHVVKAWEQEVLERGEKWLEASKLLAAYGYGIPKDAPHEDKPDEKTIEGERVTPEKALAALTNAPGR